MATLSDGFTNLERGMNAGLSPSILPSNQYAFGINTTVRGGFVTNRPEFDKIDLVFNNSSEQTAFQTGRVQAVGVYEGTDRSYIMALVSGKVYRIDPSRPSGQVNVLDLTPSGHDMSEFRPQGWMTQAEQYFIIQNGQDIPFIYDGAELRQSDNKGLGGLPEVPVGTAMEYAHGRLVVVRPHRRSYVVGDIRNGPTKVINFTETNVLNEGGDITVPIPGLITSVKAIAVLDQSVGQGDLVIFTEQGAASARISEPRTSWGSIPFQRTSLLGNGSTGHHSVVLVNGDIFFRSRDGIRSLAMSQRDFSTRWSTVPLSREARRILEKDSGHLLKYTQAVLFDNRLLLSINPAPLSNSSFYGRGLLALDFDLISSLGSQDPPAYEGVWTGLRPRGLVTGMFDGVERCFAIHYSNSEINELWEITKGNETGMDNRSNPIPSAIETKGFTADRPWRKKRLSYGELSVDEVKSTCLFDIRWKTDQAALWNSWHSWGVCVQTTCNHVTDPGDSCTNAITTYHKQSRVPLILPQPPDTAEDGANLRPARVGHEFQIRLAWTGKARIKQFYLHADEVPTDLIPSETENCRGITGCDIDPYTHLSDVSNNNWLLDENGNPLTDENGNILTL